MADFHINRQIKGALTITLIYEDEEGKKHHQEMPFFDALRKAEAMGFDLVAVSPNAKPYPVCKILDYGKFKYEQEKKEKSNRSRQKISEEKIIQISPNIALGDLETKAGRARKFLEAGDKVKVVCTVKGRWRAAGKSDLVQDVVNKFVAMLADIATTESGAAPSKSPHHQIQVTLVAIKKK